MSTKPMQAVATRRTAPGHVESIRFELPGGAIGYVESSSALPLVSFVLSLRSGATSDVDAKEGLTRLTARMMRRGCDGMDSSAIEAAVDRLGGEIGFDVGPSTISLHGQVIRRNLAPFIELVAKLLSTPTFDESELERLKRETVAELIESRDNDRTLSSLAFRRGLFGKHPYGRSSSGRPKAVESLTRADAMETYQRRFVRADVVLGFAGAISTEEAKQFGTQLLHALPEGPATDNSLPEPVSPVGRHLYFVDKPERTQTQIIIGSLGTKAEDNDHFQLMLATAIFGGTFTSRMMREIRSKRGWSYGTSARLAVERRRHAFTMGASPAAADCAPCVSLELELLSSLIEIGVTPRELSFIKNYLVRSHAFEIDTAPKRLGQALEVDLLGLPKDYHSKYLDHVRAVTLEGANSAVKARLSAENLVIVVVGTASEILDSVLKAIPNLAGHTVIPFDAD